MGDENTWNSSRVCLGRFAGKMPAINILYIMGSSQTFAYSMQAFFMNLEPPISCFFFSSGPNRPFASHSMWNFISNSEPIKKCNVMGWAYGSTISLLEVFKSFRSMLGKVSLETASILLIFACKVFVSASWLGPRIRARVVGPLGSLLISSQAEQLRRLLLGTTARY
jgi:hypothetical protein